MLFTPVTNPPNPWASTDCEYLEGEEPHAALQVYEDRTRSILAKNDSPDVGFNWSVNPYRGCFHACAYCLSGDTPVLMGDGRAKPLRDVRVGDGIYGTRLEGGRRRYVRTRVLDRWDTVKPAYRVTLRDGTELVASADHRFLTQRGWRYVAAGRGARPCLEVGSELLGVGALDEPPAETAEYKRGYLCGLVRGVALPDALVDLEPLQRARRYLREVGLEAREGVLAEATTNRPRVVTMRTNARAHFDRIQDACAWPDDASLDWCKGFLAGIFDAEGAYGRGALRIGHRDRRMLGETMRCLVRLGFDAIVEPPADDVAHVRVRGGLREHLRFFLATDPSIARKRSLEGDAVKSRAALRVASIVPLGIALPMVDITTGTEDFIANGVVSHNCYARPSHEYLSLGAGTDFERKIVVKPDAPELLREAFEKPSWRGDLVAFSGVTDCYQPLEASYRLTRGCLEVCAEYKNPCGVISKSPLLERDADLFVALGERARVSVAVSVPFWDAEKARAMEPYVATPQRRMRTVERLAARGVRVGVMVAPIIPGLNDEDIGDVLKAAKDAGACFAGFVLLRLPGAVKDVFEARLRANLPLRAERVLRRVRETRGGKMYDARFGTRGTGEGEYAQSIAALFEATARRLGISTRERGEGGWGGDEPTTFERPAAARRGGQLRLF